MLKRYREYLVRMRNIPLPRAPRATEAPAVSHCRPPAVVVYAPTGEILKSYRTLKGARVAATCFNKNAGRPSYRAQPEI